MAISRCLPCHSSTCARAAQRARSPRLRVLRGGARVQRAAHVKAYVVNILEPGLKQRRTASAKHSASDSKGGRRGG
jgi:hypothetical protein